jgi:hypothetical protein
MTTVQMKRDGKFGVRYKGCAFSRAKTVAGYRAAADPKSSVFFPLLQFALLIFSFADLILFDAVLHHLLVHKEDISSSYFKRQKKS